MPDKSSEPDENPLNPDQEELLNIIDERVRTVIDQQDTNSLKFVLWIAFFVSILLLIKRLI